MAALRDRKIRVITPDQQRIYDRWLQKGIKRGRPAEFGKKLPGTIKLFREVVATTAEEAASGLFQPIGDLLVFIPGKVEDILWSRLRTMDSPEHRDLWYHPYYGIKTALKKMGMHVPTPRWKKIAVFPSDIIDLQFHDIEMTEKARRDPVSGEVVERSEMGARRPYEMFIRETWIPKWLYSSKSSRDGVFLDTKRAQIVAGAFGITVDRGVKASSWFRTGTPNVVAEAERSVMIPEETFQDVKQRMITTMESLWERGKHFEPDWGMFTQAYRGMLGAMTQPFMDRLKRELDPVIHNLKHKMRSMEENRPRAYRRRGSYRPSRIHTR